MVKKRSEKEKNIDSESDQEENKINKKDKELIQMHQ